MSVCLAGWLAGYQTREKKRFLSDQAISFLFVSFLFFSFLFFFCTVLYCRVGLGQVHLNGMAWQRADRKQE